MGKEDSLPGTVSSIEDTGGTGNNVLVQVRHDGIEYFIDLPDLFFHSCMGHTIKDKSFLFLLLERLT